MLCPNSTRGGVIVLAAGAGRLCAEVVRGAASAQRSSNFDLELSIDSPGEQMAWLDPLIALDLIALKFNGQTFRVLRRDPPPAAMITPASTIAPPSSVDGGGICLIEGIRTPNSVAPTGSPRTVRLTT